LTPCALIHKGLIWASIIADICGIIATLDINGIEFAQMFDQVNYMMTDLRMPSHTQKSVRKFCFKAKDLYRVKKYRTMLQHLPPSMQNTVAKQMVYTMVKGLEASVLCYRFPLNLYADLAKKLQHQCFPPEEVFGQPRTLYALTSGVVLRLAMVRVNGAVWGEDLFVKQAILRQSHFVISFSHVRLQLLSRRDLIEVLSQHPRELRFLRKKSAKLAICRAVHRAAEYQKALNRANNLKVSRKGRFASEGSEGVKHSCRQRPKAAMTMHTGDLQDLLHVGSSLPSCGLGYDNLPGVSDRHLMRTPSFTERKQNAEAEARKSSKRGNARGKQGNTRGATRMGSKKEKSAKRKLETRESNWMLATGVGINSEEDRYYAEKHTDSTGVAMLMRGGHEWAVGDSVTVVKQGTFQGEQATVCNANWNGRVQVAMVGGEIKSYMSNELRIVPRGGTQLEVRPITREILHQYFAVNNPAKCDQVDTILANFKGGHDKLRDGLIKKYGAALGEARIRDCSIPEPGAGPLTPAGQQSTVASTAPVAAPFVSTPASDDAGQQQLHAMLSQVLQKLDTITKVQKQHARSIRELTQHSTCGLRAIADGASRAPPPPGRPLY
jgi:hypothetical protein